MKKTLNELNEELITALESKTVTMQSIIDSQEKALGLAVQIMDKNDQRLELKTKLINLKDEIIAVLEKQNASLQKDNLRLNIAIGIFLLLSFVYCIVRIFTL
jgi:hypothetical protein